jgi:ABC-type nitrate/sulfonate/bicarbonate transport system substrate-binding protein
VVRPDPCQRNHRELIRTHRRDGCAMHHSVRITTGLRSASHSAAWIGAAAGLFDKHGISASFPRLEVGGPESVAGLLRREWDFAQTGTVPIAEAVLNGGDAVILMRNTLPHDDIIIMANPDVGALGQLEGRSVGVLTDAYSGQTGVIVRRAIETAGANARYVGLGTYRKIHAALAAGEIDAAALPVDFRFLAQPRCGQTTYTACRMGVPSILATTRRMIAADRQLVLGVLRGVLEAIHLIKTRPDVAVPLLQEFVQFSDREAVQLLRDYYAPLLPVVPRPALAEGLQDVRDLFAGRYPAAATLQEADIADGSLIDELEQSGFIRTLYREDTAIRVE